MIWRSVQALPITFDIFLKECSKSTFFKSTLSETLGSQEPKILHGLLVLTFHAVRPRSVELGRDFGNLEIWVAKGDSELEMSQAMAGNAVAGAGAGSIEKKSLRKMESEIFGSD